MISSPRDLQVFTREDFARLPDEGRWEVVDGRAVLLPPPEILHQFLSDEIVAAFRQELRPRRLGFVVSAPTVFIPPLSASPSGQVQVRVPDVAVSRHRPARNYELGAPPQLFIEVLSTPRGNVERTEKLDDYARAGVSEYWIVDPFRRCVEVYRLTQGAYLMQQPAGPELRPRDFPQVTIDMNTVWEVLNG